MNHMPCKIDKCILLPICLSKISIDCQLMRNYYVYLKNERRIQGEAVWKIFNQVLPNMKTIKGPITVTNGTAHRIHKYEKNRYYHASNPLR